MYQAKSAKLNIGERGKVGLFFFFVFRFSLFIFRYIFSLFDFVISFSLLVFRFSFFVFVFRFSFFTFLFFLFLPSKSGEILYFDIQTEAKYSIFTFKTLF